jgi:hypothetical protein
LQFVLRAHELHHFDPADVRHVEIQNDELERFEGQLLDCLESARGVRETQLAMRTQACDDHVPHHFAVVDDENVAHHSSSARGRMLSNGLRVLSQFERSLFFSRTRRSFTRGSKCHTQS